MPEGETQLSINNKSSYKKDRVNKSLQHSYESSKQSKKRLFDNKNNSSDKIKHYAANNDWDTVKYFSNNRNSWADINDLESGPDKHKSSIFKNAKIEEIADINVNIQQDKDNILSHIDKPLSKVDHEPIRCTKIISSKQFNGINSFNDYISSEEVKVRKHTKNQSLLANISK